MVPQLRRPTGLFPGPLIMSLYTITLTDIMHSQGFNTTYRLVTPTLSLILTSPLYSSHIYSNSQLDSSTSKSACSNPDYWLYLKACWPLCYHDFSIFYHSFSRPSQTPGIHSWFISSTSSERLFLAALQDHIPCTCHLLHTHTHPKYNSNCSCHQNALGKQKVTQFLPIFTANNLIKAISVSHWVFHNSLSFSLLSLFQLFSTKHLEEISAISISSYHSPA